MSDWNELARKTVYDSEWVRVYQVDLQLPDGAIARDYHLIDFPQHASGVVPVRADGSLLLVDHYRFTTRTRCGWEIPAGRIEPHESALEAAVRELREETGHRAQAFRPLGHYHPANGSTNQVFNLFIATGVEQDGAIQDTNEIDAIRWFTPAQVRSLIADNAILDGLSLTALLWYLFDR